MGGLPALPGSVEWLLPCMGVGMWSRYAQPICRARRRRQAAKAAADAS